MKRLQQLSRLKKFKSYVQNEHGHSLYIVTIVSLMLLLAIGHLLTSYVIQTKMIHGRELEVRAESLINSTIPVWITQGREQLNEGEQALYTLEDGQVHVVLLNDTEHYDKILLKASITDTNVSKKVYVKISKESDEIIDWQYDI